MKNKTLRNDLIVIVILFLIIGGLFFFKSRKQGQLIEITKDNQIYGYYSLNEDQIIKIDQENTIQIKNQKVKMIQATCPDHLCIKQGTIDKKGSTIVCLPHHLIIEIKEMYTVTQIVEKLKLELVGKQFNFTTVCVSIRRFLTGLPWEEKGETQLDDMEGEDGREYNSMTFFVKSTMEEFSGICISYDSAYLIRDVKVFTKYEE